MRREEFRLEIHLRNLKISISRIKNSYKFVFRLKHRNQVADMNTICDEVRRDWSGQGSDKSVQLKEPIHAALSLLIKQRRVYYTGNKGYFLVNPSDANSPFKGLGNRFNKLRHSLRISNSHEGSKKSPSFSNMVDQECQTLGGIANNASTSSPQNGQEIGQDSWSSGGLNGSNESSPGGSFNLERSQSLRISKKSLRNMAKGGSLR